MPTVADFIEQHRDALIRRFAEEAGRMESARGLSGYELTNTFPEYLGLLAAMSRQGRQVDLATTKNRLEETHLSLRLRLGYNQEEVTDEYVLMGRLIAALWEGLPREQQPDSRDTALLFHELQAAMDHTIVFFSGYSVEDRQREKRALRRLDALDPESITPNSKPELLRQQLTPLLEVIQEAMGAQGTELYLSDASHEHLLTAAASGQCSEQRPGLRIPLQGESFLDQVAGSEEPIHLADAATAPGTVTEGLHVGGLRSLLGLRLWPHGSLLGIVYVGRTKVGSFEPQARRYFETLVEYLSGIVDRALLLGRVREAEEHWRLFAQSLQEYATIYQLDAEGLVTSWNPGAERFEGYREEEVLGKSVKIFYPPDAEGQAEAEAHLREASVSGRSSAEGWRVRNTPDSPFWAEVTLIATRDASGALRGFTKVTRDLTQQRRAQEERERLYAALRESEDRLRLAAAAAQVGTWDFDPATGHANWDARSKALFGLPPDAEVTWERFLSGVHPEDRARTEAAARRALMGEEGGTYDIEYRTVGLEDGIERWVAAHGRAFFDEQGRAVRFIGTLLDITGRRRMEEALKQSERQFRTLAESMPQIVWTAAADGVVDYVNVRLAEYSGVSVEELIGAKWLELLHPDNRPHVVDSWVRSVAAGEPYEVEQHLRGKDGRYRWFLTRALPVRDAEGHVLRWLGTSTDIEDLKRAQTEMTRRADFEEKLIGIVSHDLRNPLNAITLAAGTMLRRVDLDERVKRGVGRISDAAERANRMIRDLLDFTQARLRGSIPIQRRALDFHAFVAQVLDEVRLAFPERRIEDAHSGTGEGEWDADRLAQVVINLVNNALAYSPPDTPVRVETHGEDGLMCLTVHNQGPPIPPEMQRSIFEPMQRGTQKGGTTSRSIGMGLFIVDHIVRAHGGSIQVRSTQEEGTTFTVQLPRRPPV